MPRPLCAALVAGAVGGAVLVATPVAAAAGHARRPASSVALFASDNATFRSAKSIAGNTPHRTARLVTSESRTVATGITANANGALACADSFHIYPIRSLRTKPELGKPLNASRFANEGGKGFSFFCDGLSVRGGFALAAGDSQGVVQLTRRHGSWRFDRRVRSPGVDEAGHPHRPGWIRFRDSATSTTYRTVSIAPHPLHGGSYLAVAVDRADGTVAVIKGAGTPKPRNVGLLTSARLVSPVADYGAGGVAWQPRASNRALIATDTGFAVLDLSHPAKPRLERLTKVGDGTSPGTLSVSPGGDHVAVAAGRHVFGYGRVRAAVARGRRFRLETTFRVSKRAQEAVRDAVYTADGNLLVLHGDDQHGWFLTVVQKVARGRHAVRGSMPTTRPADSGSLSVWPAP